MTDDEAKRVLNSQLPNHSTVLEDSLRHALQAIADRAALVEAWLTEDEPEAMLAARRHMKGK